MQLKLKDTTVRLDGLDYRLLQALVTVGHIWFRHGVNEVVVTSALDGEHKPNSQHYSGRALDLRSRTLPDVFGMCDELRDALPADIDVIVETDHIHMQLARTA